MARANCITSANISNQATPRGTTVRIQNSYPAGRIRTFNTDTTSATDNKQNKPATLITFNE